MIGDPKQGIQEQSEELFDYEQFIPPVPTVAEQGNAESLRNEELDAQSSEIDALLNFSMDEEPSVFFNENLNRTSRYNLYMPYASIDQITDILTTCSLEQKELYESNGLSCTDLRKIIQF